MENNKTIEGLLTRLEAVQVILKKFNGIDFNSADTATINEAMSTLNEAQSIVEKLKEIEIKRFNEINKTLEDNMNVLKALASQTSTVAQQVANLSK